METPSLPVPHAATAETVLESLKVDPKSGLTEENIQSRLAHYGPNILPETKRKPRWRIFLNQFQSPLIYILLAAGILAFLLGKHEDAIVILIVVLINAIIGAIQEGRVEHS